MRRPRKPTPPTTEAIDQFCAAFDDLFGRYEERRALRQVPDSGCSCRVSTTRRSSNSPASCLEPTGRRCITSCTHAPRRLRRRSHRRRRAIAARQAHPYLGPHAGGVLIVDETGRSQVAATASISWRAQQLPGQARTRRQIGVDARLDQSVDRAWRTTMRRWASNPSSAGQLELVQVAAKIPDLPYEAQRCAWQLIEEARAAGSPSAWWSPALSTGTSTWRSKRQLIRRRSPTSSGICA